MEEQNKWLDIIAKLYKELHMSKGAMKGMKDNDKKRDRITMNCNNYRKIKLF